MVDPNRPFDPSEDPAFEQELRRDLQPRSAPPDFAARLMQRLPTESSSTESRRVPHSSLILAGVGHDESQPALFRRRARIFSFPPALRLAAVASVLIVIFAGTFGWQQRQQRIAGQRATQQVMTALQITRATLQQVADNVSSIQNRKEPQP